MRLSSILRIAVIILLTAMALQESHADDKPTKKSESKSIALPRSVDLRPQLLQWGLLPRSQGARNTCSVFVTTGALEFAVSKHYGRSIPLSVEYLNWASNQVVNNKTQDRGHFFHDLLKGFSQYGVCPESDMPYQSQFNPNYMPSDKAKEKAGIVRGLGLQVHWINPWNPQPGLTNDHVREIKAVLAKGYPVGAGSSHSRLIVGYVDDVRSPSGGVFMFKDSGAAAFNSLPYDHVKEKFGDVFWIEAPVPPNKKKP